MCYLAVQAFTKTSNAPANTLQSLNSFSVGVTILNFHMRWRRGALLLPLLGLCLLLLVVAGGSLLLHGPPPPLGGALAWPWRRSAVATPPPQPPPPPPRRQGLVALVLTAPGNSEARTAMRKTWLSQPQRYVQGQRWVLR